MLKILCKERVILQVTFTGKRSDVGPRSSFPTWYGCALRRCNGTTDSARFPTSPKLDTVLTKIVIGPMSPCGLDVCGGQLWAVLARAGESTFWRCLTSILEFSVSEKNSKEDYKPRKWGASARYYASHTKTMLPTRKSVSRSSRQLGHTKIWRS